MSFLPPTFYFVLYSLLYCVVISTESQKLKRWQSFSRSEEIPVDILFASYRSRVNTSDSPTILTLFFSLFSLQSTSSCAMGGTGRLRQTQERTQYPIVCYKEVCRTLWRSISSKYDSQMLLSVAGSCLVPVGCRTLSCPEFSVKCALLKQENKVLCHCERHWPWRSRPSRCFHHAFCASKEICICSARLSEYLSLLLSLRIDRIMIEQWYTTFPWIVVSVQTQASYQKLLLLTKLSNILITVFLFCF